METIWGHLHKNICMQLNDLPILRRGGGWGMSAKKKWKFGYLWWHLRTIWRLPVHSYFFTGFFLLFIFKFEKKIQDVAPVGGFCYITTRIFFL
jgi:hypothetical protein